jgi:fructosamine-3-kinase
MPIPGHLRAAPVVWNSPSMTSTSLTHESLESRVARVLGDIVVRARTLTGGKRGDVVRIDLERHGPVVAKAASPDSRLTLEAAMLRHLRDVKCIPVPEVLYADDGLLVLGHIDGEHLRPEAEPHCGELLAQLHDVCGLQFGFASETLNGRIVLPSPWTNSWISFFREYRLRFSMMLADRHYPLPEECRRDLQHILERTDRLLREPAHPSLLHGDLWAANVLCADDRVTAFLDPSACYGDPEFELAYIDAWGSFGPGFWDAYCAHHAIDDGFHSVRKHVYALYPLLMHVYYFGDRFLPRLQRAIAAVKSHL